MSYLLEHEKAVYRRERLGKSGGFLSNQEGPKVMRR
jgi:hypothetical protein